MVFVWAGILIAIVIAIAALYLPSSSGNGGSPLVSSSANGGNVTDYTAVNTDAGYWVAGTQVVNSAGVWLQGILAAAAAQFDSSVVFSYTNATSTTGTVVTLAASDLAYSQVVMVPNTGALTVTFPASSSLSSFLPVAGDRARQCWVNATGTAAGIIIFAASAGIDYEKNATSTVAAAGQTPIGASNSACFEWMRIGAGANASDFIVQQTSFFNAD